MLTQSEIDVVIAEATAWVAAAREEVMIAHQLATVEERGASEARCDARRAEFYETLYGLIAAGSR